MRLAAWTSSPLSEVLLVAISRVNAYASFRIRRSLPADQGGNAGLGRAVVARDQARRLLRVIGRKDGERVRLYSRLGNDLTQRFPLIRQAVDRLRVRSSDGTMTGASFCMRSICWS